MTRPACRTGSLAGVVALAALLLPAHAARAVAPCPGTYKIDDPAVAGGPGVALPDGGAAPTAGMDKASAKLELTPQGRFAYSFKRGDHEESAQGRWRAGEDRVILTGDPVTAPAFMLVADEPRDEASLRIDLDLSNGLSRQYFTAAVRLADGAIVGRAFTEAPFAFAVDQHDPPVALRIDLPSFALSSAEFAVLPGAGHLLHIRFAANDLGKIAFVDTPLIEREGALILPRPGGDLALRREGRCSAE